MNSEPESSYGSISPDEAYNVSAGSDEKLVYDADDVWFRAESLKFNLELIGGKGRRQLFGAGVVFILVALAALYTAREVGWAEGAVVGPLWGIWSALAVLYLFVIVWSFRAMLFGYGIVASVKLALHTIEAAEMSYSVMQSFYDTKSSYATAGSVAYTVEPAPDSSMPSKGY